MSVNLKEPIAMDPRTAPTTAHLLGLVGALVDEVAALKVKVAQLEKQPKTTEPELPLPAARIAEQLGVTVATVNKAFREGRVDGFKAGKTWAAYPDRLREALEQNRLG